MHSSRTSTDSKRSGHRRAVLRRLVLLLIGVAGAGAAVAAVLEAKKRLKQSDDFRLAALELRGLRLLKGDEILRASGLAVGDNIFAVDLDKIAARLDSLAWVKSATVQRKPPDRLAIAIVERRRLAWVADGSRSYCVDDTGVQLPSQSLPGEAVADLNLPVIRASARSSRSDGDHHVAAESVSDSSVVQMIEWLVAASAADSAFCRNISEMRSLDENSVRLGLVGDGLEVRLPISPVAERLPLIKQVLERVYREFDGPGYVDLRFADQVVVGPTDAPRSRQQKVGRR